MPTGARIHGHHLRVVPSSDAKTNMNAAGVNHSRVEESQSGPLGTRFNCRAPQMTRTERAAQTRSPTSRVPRFQEGASARARTGTNSAGTATVARSNATVPKPVRTDPPVPMIEPKSSAPMNGTFGDPAPETGNQAQTPHTTGITPSTTSGANAVTLRPVEARTAHGIATASQT